jgi:DNA repair protein RadC
MNKKRIHDSYPLQKCIHGQSIESLSDLELLSIIIGTGIKTMTVFDISSRLLQNYGDFKNILSAGIRELSQFTGIGLKKAIRLQAAIELGKRALKSNSNNLQVGSPHDVWKLLMPDILSFDKEEFFALALNNNNCIIKKDRIFIGTVNESIVHPREVFRNAIRESASAIIIAHNHPSGNITPSEDDIITTKRLYKVGEIIGIKLLDHVILTQSSFLSLKECGYI